MLTSIKSLVVGDVIKAEGFVSRVLDCQHYDDYAAVTVEFIEGDKGSFDYLSGWSDTCQIQGHDKLVTVELIQAEFITV